MGISKETFEIRKSRQLQQMMFISAFLRSFLEMPLLYYIMKNISIGKNYFFLNLQVLSLQFWHFRIWFEPSQNLSGCFEQASSQRMSTMSEVKKRLHEKKFLMKSIGVNIMKCPQSQMRQFTQHLFFMSFELNGQQNRMQI